MSLHCEGASLPANAPATPAGQQPLTLAQREECLRLGEAELGRQQIVRKEDRANMAATESWIEEQKVRLDKQAFQVQRAEWNIAGRNEALKMQEEKLKLDKVELARNEKRVAEDGERVERAWTLYSIERGYPEWRGHAGKLGLV